MSMRKKPVKLKILEGNPGHQNLNYEEPEPEQGEPDIPEQLTSQALTIWENTCHHLSCMGILARCDEILIELFARVVARWQALEREIDNEGQFMITPIRTKSGEVLRDDQNNILITSVENPRLKEARLLMQQMRMIASELGLSPTARARLSFTANKPQQKSKMEELLTHGRTAS